MGIGGSVRRLGAVVAVVCLLAAGCTDADGDAEPTAAPTEVTVPPEPSPTVSATEPVPGPTQWPEPVRPAAMERDDIEGAKAAAEYFLELYPYVYITGDLGAWNDISHPECSFCASVIDNAEALHEGGGYADGPDFEIVSVEAAPPDDEYEFYSVWIEASELGSARYDRDGNVTETYEESFVSIDLALVRDSGRWAVRGAVGKGLSDDASDD